MLKIEGLNLVWVVLTASIPVLAPFFPLLKDFISATISRAVKDRAAIEKLRLDLDNLLNKEKYIQDINVLNIRMLKKIPFEKVNILLRKDISLTQLINLSEVTKKELCLYIPPSKEMRIVSESQLKVIKKEDKYLASYFYIFVILIILFIIDVVFFQEIISMILLFFLILLFEVIWLLRKSPYDSYKELTNNEESISQLRDQGVIFVQDIS